MSNILNNVNSSNILNNSNSLNANSLNANSLSANPLNANSLNANFLNGNSLNGNSSSNQNLSSTITSSSIHNSSSPNRINPTSPKPNHTPNSSILSPSINARLSIVQPPNLTISSLNIPESCEFCSIILCKKCELCCNNCHYFDLSGPNKNINSYIHCNNNKTVIVDSSRLLFTNENIDKDNINITSITSASSSPAFNSFYNQFKGLARRFEIYDADDTILWNDKLSYKYAYLFSDSKFALITLKQHSFLKKDVLGPLISFNFCTPCSSYQIVYPESRAKHPNKVNDYYLPNFYSTSICRKNNIIHDKARSTSTFIHMQNIRSSSSIGNSPLTSPRLNSLMISTAASPSPGHYNKRHNSFSATPRGSFTQSNDNSNFKSFSLLPPTALSVETQMSQNPMSPSYDKKPNIFGLASKSYSHLEISAALNKSINQSCELYARRDSDNSIKSPQLRGLSLRDDYNTPLKHSRSNSFKDPNLPVTISPMFLPIFAANSTMDLINISNGFEGVKYLNEISELSFPKVLQNKSFTFVEKLCLSLIEERHYKYFLEYLEKFPIVSHHKHLSFRFDIHKVLAILCEILDVEITFSPPSLPCIGDLLLSPACILENGSLLKSSGTLANLRMLSDKYDLNQDTFFERFNPTWSTKRKKLFELMFGMMNVLKAKIETEQGWVNDPLLWISYHMFALYIQSSIQVTGIDYSSSAMYEKSMFQYSNLIVKTQQLSHKAFKSHQFNILNFLVLKQIICNLYMFIAQTSSRFKSIHRRKRLSFYIYHLLIENLNDIADEKLLMSLRNLNNISDSPIMPNYQFIDFFAINYHVLMLSLCSEPTFCVRGENASCDPTNNATLKKLDCSEPAFAIKILHQMADDAMDHILYKEFESFCNTLSGSSMFEEGDIIPLGKDLNQIKPTCSLSCCYVDSGSFIEKSSVRKGKIILDEMVKYRSFLLFSAPSLFIDTSTSLEYLHKENFNSTCPTFSISIENFWSSLPRAFEASLCDLNNAKDWMVQACEIAVSCNSDITSILNAFWGLTMCQMFWMNDYAGAFQTLEKLEAHAYTFLRDLRNSTSFSARRFVFSMVIRSRSLRIQFRQHVETQSRNHFFPGEIVHIKIGEKFEIHEAVYVSFEHNAQPMYITKIRGKGVCWAVHGSDLSSINAWRSILFDNLYSYSTTHLLICQRILIHVFRTKTYTYDEFKEDLMRRQKLPIAEK